MTIKALMQSALMSQPFKRQAEGQHMRFQNALLMLKPRDPCPVCGAETTLTEIEPHPLNVNLEVHGYFCGRCGPVKSLVVLRA